MATPGPSNFTKFSSILAEINATAQDLENENPGSREKLQNLCGSLSSVLEGPGEMIQRIGWAELTP